MLFFYVIEMELCIINYENGKYSCLNNTAAQIKSCVEVKLWSARRENLGNTHCKLSGVIVCNFTTNHLTCGGCY